jgi:hypothetical protein
MQKVLERFPNITAESNVDACWSFPRNPNQKYILKIDDCMVEFDSIKTRQWAYSGLTAVIDELQSREKLSHFSKDLQNNCHPVLKGDILQVVFSFLTFEDYLDVIRASLVCKIWFKVSQNNQIWKLIWKVRSVL